MKGVSSSIVLFALLVFSSASPVQKLNRDSVYIVEPNGQDEQGEDVPLIINPDVGEQKPESPIIIRPEASEEELAPGPDFPIVAEPGLPPPEYEDISEPDEESPEAEYPIVVEPEESESESEEHAPEPERPITVEPEHPASESEEENISESEEESPIEIQPESEESSQESEDATPEPESESAEEIVFQENGCPVNPHIHWLLPQEDNCNQFYQCVWGVKVLKQCSSILHFNAKLQVCDWPWAAGCDPESQKLNRPGLIKYAPSTSG